MTHVTVVKVIVLAFICQAWTAQHELCAFVTVRKGKDISAYEEAVLNIRYALIKKTVQAFVSEKLDDRCTPKNGLVFSGGGCRAAIGSLAAVDALAQMDFMDIFSHMSCLSGSTWMLASLLANNCSCKELAARLKDSLQNIRAGLDVKSIYEQLKAKAYTHNQNVSLTDVYGCLIAHLFLRDVKDKGQSVCFSDMREVVSSGMHPFPLLSAALDGRLREIIEFSPWEIGSADYLRSWVRTEDFGKRFDAGVSVDDAPEQTLGFLLGICGSAYAFGYSDITKFLYDLVDDLKKHWSFCSAPHIHDDYQKHTNLFQDFCRIQLELSSKMPVQGLFQTAARVNNFTQNMEHSPIRNLEELVLMDAAFVCNLPLAPLLVPARSINFYVVCDFSGGAKSVAINQLEEYAQRKGYKLPLLDHERIDNNEVCLFYNEHDATVPVIVYIPHPADISTLQFQFSEQDFNKHYDSVYSLVMACRDLIIQGLNIAVENAKRCASFAHEDSYNEVGNFGQGRNEFVEDETSTDQAVGSDQNFDVLYASMMYLPESRQIQLKEKVKAELQARGLNPEAGKDLRETLRVLSNDSPDLVAESIENVKKNTWCTIL